MPISLVLGTLMLTAAAAGTDLHPDFFQVDVDRFGKWSGEIRTFITWHDDEPYFESAVCELDNGPLSMRFRRGGQSGRRSYPDIWIDEEAIGEERTLEQVEIQSLSIGSRSFQVAREDWQGRPWFSNFGYKENTIIAGTGDGFLTYQEAADDPPLAIGLLLDEMFDAKRLRIHYSALTESRDAGEEVTYGHLDIDNSELKQAVSWCVEGLVSRRLNVLPTEMGRADQ